MIDEMRALRALAETGSVQKASERLHLTQSAVSRQIQRLEDTLGATLLDRRNKPPTLTHAGRRVLDRSRQILSAVDELRTMSADEAEPDGVLRVGISHSIAEAGLAEPLYKLARRYPSLSLSLIGGWTAELVGAIGSGQLDAAVVLTNPDRSRDRARRGGADARHRALSCGDRTAARPAAPRGPGRRGGAAMGGQCGGMRRPRCAAEGAGAGRRRLPGRRRGPRFRPEDRADRPRTWHRAAARAPAGAASAAARDPHRAAPGGSAASTSPSPSCAPRIWAGRRAPLPCWRSPSRAGSDGAPPPGPIRNHLDRIHVTAPAGRLRKPITGRRNAVLRIDPVGFSL